MRVETKPSEVQAYLHTKVFLDIIKWLIAEALVHCCPFSVQGVSHTAWHPQFPLVT
jgi:hypothetical protein